MYRKAFARLYARDKRDWSALHATIGPVLRCIADLALEMHNAASDRSAAVAEALVDEALKGTQKRAAKWPPSPSLGADEIGELAGPEFLRAVRGIHINASRQLSAMRAAAEVEFQTEEEQSETD
jgi:hypothetical protein